MLKWDYQIHREQFPGGALHSPGTYESSFGKFSRIRRDSLFVCASASISLVFSLEESSSPWAWAFGHFQEELFYQEDSRMLAHHKYYLAHDKDPWGFLDLEVVCLVEV
jgi:hypothetical protein